MTDDYNDLNLDDENEEEEGAPAPAQSNRTFLLAAGILGGLFLFGLILIALFVFLIRPGQQAALVASSNTATAVVMTQSAESLAQTSVAKAPTVVIPTATQTPKPATPTSTHTPVVAVPTEPDHAEETSAAANTATVSALLTEVAQAQTTQTPGTGGVTDETPNATPLPTSTALPTTGFADEVGIPGLVGLAVVLMIVIFVVRRLRTA